MIAEELSKKNISFEFMDSVLWRLEYRNAEGNLRHLTIKQDLRSNFLSSKTKMLIYQSLSKDYYSYYSRLRDLFEILPYIDYETAYFHSNPRVLLFYEHYTKLDLICILVGFAFNFLLLFNYRWFQGIYEGAEARTISSI